MYFVSSHSEIVADLFTDDSQSCKNDVMCTYVQTYMYRVIKITTCTCS